jgi:talin
VLQGTSNSADGEELRTRTLQAGQDVAVQYRELLQTVLHIVSRPGGAADAKQNLPPISRRIAQCVTELVTSAELLKGSVCCHDTQLPYERNSVALVLKQATATCLRS